MLASYCLIFLRYLTDYDEKLYGNNKAYLEVLALSLLFKNYCAVDRN